MTELRDARLRKAMEAAPDAHAQPPARLREAIRAAAHGAVQPWWRRWWAAPPGQAHAVRWIAFASVALVVGGVVLNERWGMAPAEQDVSVAQAPPPAPPPTVAIAPVPAQVPPAAAPEVAERPQPRPAPRAGGAPAPDPARRARAPVLADAPPAPVEAPPRAAPSEDRSTIIAAAPPPPPPAAAPDLLGKAAPPEARSEAAPAAPAAAAPPLPPLAQAPAPRAAAPAAPAAALRAGPTALPWTQVRIESGGRSVVVPRMQAGELASLLTTLLASPSDEAEPGPSGSLRLELAQGDETAGVLELVGDRWRWTSLRESRRPRLLMPDPGVAAALRERAEALVRK